MSGVGDDGNGSDKAEWREGDGDGDGGGDSGLGTWDKRERIK